MTMATGGNDVIAYSEDSLDHDLYKSKLQFSKIVKTHVSVWVQLYEQQKNQALISVVALVFRACKCPVIVESVIPSDSTGWQCYLENVEQTLEALDASCDPVVPLIEDKMYFYAKNLSLFLNCILESRCGILLDNFFTENLTALLNVLCRSPYRNFRHGSTLIALKMITKLSEMMKNNLRQLSVCQRQLTAETSKSSSQRSTERIENLEGVLNEAEMECRVVENIINTLYKGGVNERFRDVSSDICLMCLDELAIWINHHSRFYVRPKYLEHLRHSLIDSKTRILTRTLKVVKSVYLNGDFPEMEAFSSVIRGSILRLSVSENAVVSCLAVQVASAMIKCDSESLKEDEKLVLMLCVFSPVMQTSCEAALFIHGIIMETLKDHAGINPNFASLYLIELKDFIVKTDTPGKVGLLVESMLSTADLYLLNWKSYVALLLMDELNTAAPHLLRGLPNDLSSSLKSDDENIIISLMLNCLKQLSTQESPRHGKKAKNQYSSKIDEDKRQELLQDAGNIMAFIPRMITKFMADISKINDLLSICSMVDVSGFTGSEEIRRFGDAFKKLMTMNVDQEIHVKGAKLLAHLCGDNHLFDLYVVKPFLNHAADKWRNTLKSYLQVCHMKLQSQSSPSGEEEKDEENIIFALNKYCSILWSISCHFSMDEYVDYDELFQLSLGKIKDCRVPDKVMEYCYKILHAIILREAKEVENEEFFKSLVEQFCNVGKKILEKFKISTKFSTYMCLAEHICMLRSLMNDHSSWMTNCWRDTTMSLVKFFISTMTREGEFEHLSKKEEEDTILTFLMLIKKRVLPLEAVAYPLAYYNAKPMKKYSHALKDTMSVAQSWGMEDFVQCLHDALSYCFHLLLDCDAADDEMKGKMFKEIQELAKLLKKEFGPSLSENRMATLKLHKLGLYLATTSNFKFDDPLYAAPFLMILKEFQDLLHPTDKIDVANQLIHRLTVMEVTSDACSKGIYNHYMQCISRGVSLSKEGNSRSLRSRGENSMDETNGEMSI
ncbi:cohesin subunit SA-1-like [Ischnura elegans]|uniref:cohesin subunit SA-1-like n=1 Tax=Ischnura elegans TaxID=197161 RepID=UPI001ED8699C|nr:cohesin subunit SA-1-like [Ischnura elegans]